jgi:cytochrome c-type biogenesis protein CcmH
MLSFWLISALLLLLPLFVILITLLKTHNEDNTELFGNTDLYQQRLSEIESDIDNGLLSGTEAKKVKKEYQRALLIQDENKPLSENYPKTEMPSKITAILLLILIPVFVISLYDHLGKPELIIQTDLLSEFNNAQNTEQKLASIEKMLNQLEQRLINEPDDVDGWMMLTNSYATLERYPEALRAVNNLYRLKNNDPTVLIRYADILSMTNGGIYTGRPTELINEALRLDPENKNGLWLAGLAANERGDIENSIIYWQRLVSKLEQGSNQRQQIEKYIQLAKQHIEGGKKKKSNTDKQEYKIQVNVSLSANLISEVNSEDTVFIYAQAINGSQMPIAIIRKKVSDLPIQATLDDSIAMMPSNKLSDHKQVKLTARISKSGNATAEPGDLIGRLDTIQTDTNKIINLNIDKKIP